MPETRTFWVPDYYERFRCKADACRTNCCHGWGITISMQDYYHLLSVPCSQELRRKLDTSLHLVRGADTQRFAQILPNWLGNCPLQREDGLCALQAECGEEILSSTCRYYPRGVRTAFEDECCCSGSCEGVLEAMFAQREPIRLVQRTMTFDLPLTPRAESVKEAGDAKQIQCEWLTILQDRHFPLAERMQRLGCAAHALHRGDAREPLGQMEDALRSFEPQRHGDLLAAFAVQRDILSIMAEHSESIRPFAQEVMTALGLEDAAEDETRLSRAYARYEAAAAHLEAVLPDWDICFEHMLVNHALYQGYPYSVRHESVWDEYIALCALYAALRILTVGYMAQRETRNDFVDVCAAAFKLFDHSNFDHNAMVLFYRKGLSDKGAMGRLCLC